MYVIRNYFISAFQKANSTNFLHISASKRDIEQHRHVLRTITTNTKTKLSPAHQPLTEHLFQCTDCWKWQSVFVHQHVASTHAKHVETFANNAISVADNFDNTMNCCLVVCFSITLSSSPSRYTLYWYYCYWVYAMGIAMLLIMVMVTKTLLMIMTTTATMFVY